MESLLNHALTYAQVNCKVFPLKVNSKNGQVLISLKEKVTTDKEQITKWFTNTDYIPIFEGAPNKVTPTGNNCLIMSIFSCWGD